MTDQELIENWLKTGRRRSPRTRTEYQRIVNRLLADAFPKTLAEIDSLFLARYCEPRPMLKNRDLQESANTRKLRIAVLKSLFGYAYGKKHISENIAEEILSLKVDLCLDKKLLSEEEIFSIFALESNPKKKLMWRVLYAGGFRIFEFVSLRWENLDGNCLHFVGKGDKKRKVYLSEAVTKELEEFKPANVDPYKYMFPSPQGGGHYAPGTMSKWLKSSAYKAGIKRNITPHMFRHSHATHAARRGCPIAVLRDSLGHKNISTTNIYLHSEAQDSSPKYLPI